MQCEYFSFYEGSEREVVKEVCEVFPHGGISIFSETFIIEAVATRVSRCLHLGDLAGLMVPTENSDTVFIADLQANQQCHSFDGVVASIDVVAHEEVVGVGRDASNLEELHEVVELAMDVSTHGDWAAYGLDIGFILEYLLRLGMKKNILFHKEP